jgi:hypothetical protein
MIRTGHCLCGKLRYEVSGDLAPVINCHCHFCRRVHGAAFTTVAFLPRDAFSWLSPDSELGTFPTPAGNCRHFCARCSTPILNSRPGVNVACLVVSSLLDEFQPAPWFHANTESKSPFFSISDELPQFETWPSPKEVRAFAKAHGTRIPLAMLEPDVESK